MDGQLRLHVENLSMFVEPVFNRHTVGYYSVNSRSEYVADDSEKASLVALKERERIAQGVIEYEVPTYIEELNITEGYETYNDSSDNPEQKDLVGWLKTHPKECADVDIVCSRQAISRIYRAPYSEPTSTPWELKVVRGPDGICYLHDEDTGPITYSEMNIHAKKQYFKQKAFQRYMTIKKGVRNKYTPPSDHKNAFFRVNKLELDSGVIVYQSELQCFDINYNTIDLKVQPEGQYDLPAPTTRLQWWSDCQLSGADTLMCGYYSSEDMEDESVVHRIVSFDIKHFKPRRVRDEKFDEEICTGSLCTFVQFVKDITVDESIKSFTLRFEPGSKRICILDPERNRKIDTKVPSFGTQISATDETSSVETTPRAPKEDETRDSISGMRNGLGKEDLVPRLRMFNRQDSNKPPMARKNSITTEMGVDAKGAELGLDNDEDKYGPKTKDAKEEDANWVHIVVIMSFIAFSFIVIPWIIEALGHTSPY